MRQRMLLLAALMFPALGQAAQDFLGKEVDCLALNIYHEARGEPQEGQIAVAYVTMNRLVSPRYPNSVCDVVWQNGQFSWTKDDIGDKPSDVRAWSRARQIAQFVYSNYFRLRAVAQEAADPTRGALMYYSFKKVNPFWARSRNMVATTTIGSHLFLKDNS